MTIPYWHPHPHPHPWRLALGAALLALLLAGCAAVKPQALDPAPPPSHSVAQADARLARTAGDKARAEAAFAASEQVCYTRFLVNNCLDKAREQRREALAGVRAIEIEADRFKRQAKVDERDRELAKAQADFQAEEARMAAAPPPRAVEPAPKPAVARQSKAAPAAKSKNGDAEDPAGAAERAAKVAAFEKRKRNSERRLREIEEKKKKKVNERERAAQ